MMAMTSAAAPPALLAANASLPLLGLDAMVAAALQESAALSAAADRVHHHRRREYSPLLGAAADPEAAAAREELSRCLNATVLEEYVRGVVGNATTLSRRERRRVEGDPLVYIVAVLLFYSCGIAVLMINYMKKEQNEDAETNLYKQYVDKRDRCGGGGGGHDDPAVNRGRSLNRLALQALNAVNVVSQDGEQSSRVAFV